MPRPLLALLAISAVLSLAWSMATAPLQGPDERSHASYVQHLAETGHVPSPAAGTRSDSREIGTAVENLRLLALVGVPAARPATGEADVRAWDRLQPSLGHAERADGDGPNPLAKNPPLFYAYDAIAYRAFAGAGLFTRLTAMRVASVLLHLLAVVAMWYLAAELFASRWLQTVATGMFALQTVTTYIGSVVNSDSLLVTVWVALALACVRLVKRGPSIGRVLAVCGLAAASALTHGRGLAAAPAVLAVLVIAAVVHRPPLRAMAVRLAAAAALVAVPLLVYRLAFIGAHTGGELFGGQASEQLAVSLHPLQLAGWTWEFYLSKLSSLGARPGPDYGYRQVFVDTFLGGSFGSLEVTYPLRVYDVLQVAAGLGLAGLYSAVLVRRRALLARWPVLLALGALLVSMMGLLHYSSYRSLAGGSADPLITGRYLTPLAAIYALAVTFVVWTLPARARPYAGATLLAAATLLHLAGIGLTGLRFYA